MTVITGDLILVTDRPSAVTEVWIRAGEIRTHDGGLIVDDRDREPVHNGWLEINVLPGPAILTLVSHGTVRKAIPIVVPDAEATSLEDAVNAAKLAQPSLKAWLEELAASILAGTKGPKGDRGPEGKQGPAGPAPYIQNGTWWTGGVDTGIDATGPQGAPGIAPHIQGETWWVGEVDTGILAQGPKGDPGDKGDPGPTGTLDLIDESAQTTIDTVVVPAIEGARDEALGQVSGAVATEIGGRVDDIKRGNYGTILSTADVDRYDTIPPGNYTALTPFLQGIGLPGPHGSGTVSRILTNFAQDGASKLDMARWVIGGKIYEYYQTYSSSGWSGWISFPDLDTLLTERTRTIPNGADWDTITAPGEHRRISTAHTGTSMPTTTLGVLQVHSPQHSSGQVTQTYFGAGGGGFWHRAKTSNRWTPWLRMDVVPKDPDVPGRVHAGEARREVIVELGKRKRGGVIGTGGLPAVALRFDHHLDHFDAKVLPLLRKYNLPWMQAINAGNLGKGTDNWTAAKLTTECHRTGGEVWNHGLDHSTYTTDAEADRQITGGLTQLTNAMPSLHIDGWAPYGSFPQGAFEAGKSAADIYSTYPGQLILAQHAFIRTYLPGQHERLAGPQMIGGNHSTIDSDTTGAAIRGLKSAMARGMGITFMLHPVYLDQAGYMSTAQFEALLAEIAARRDAGELRVLSCTGIMLADKARPDDFNLLGTLSAPNSTGTETVNSRSYALTTGVPHEAEVWVHDHRASTLTVTVDSPTYPVTVTSEMAADEEGMGSLRRLSVVLTPPTDTTGISVTLAGGSTHQGVKFRPI